jgi:hypothetical protein
MSAYFVGWVLGATKGVEELHYGDQVVATVTTTGDESTWTIDIDPAKGLARVNETMKKRGQVVKGSPNDGKLRAHRELSRFGFGHCVPAKGDDPADPYAAISKKPKRPKPKPKPKPAAAAEA